jgi:hypothetical protein
MYKSVTKLLRVRQLWTIALYEVNRQDEIFNLDSLKPFHFIGERGFRTNRGYQSTVADPFLFTHNDKLYIFYEVKTDFGQGEIHAQAMDASGNFTNLGLVLKEMFHLSYPQVFSHNGYVWMIPEAGASEKLWLYRADYFPRGWVKERVLIDERLVDTSLIIQDDGLYLLGTNRSDELKVYYAANLQDEFAWTGVTITADRAYSRNAGRPLRINGDLFRVAQNCRNTYGENISVHKVQKLTTKNYEEELTMPSLFINKPTWMGLGNHHISVETFTGRHFVAIDGMRPDRFINNLLLAPLKIFAKYD